MSSIPRKKIISSSKSAPSTSQPTQQLPLRQLPSPLGPQSYPSQQLPDSPWSVFRPTFRSKNVPSSMLPSPFPRDGHTLSTTATGGELLFFGGYARHSLRNELYVFSTRDGSLNLLQTSGEVPSPRFKPAAALVNSILLIWGGVTKFDEQEKPKGPYDDSLYLLSLVSQVWTRVVVNGPRPVVRHGMAVTVVDSKLFVFGGKTDRGYPDDMWALDLNSLNSKPVWYSYEPTTSDEKPPPRSHHVLVTTGERIILFGGTNAGKRYNDTWLYNISTRKWTELECTGCIPSPRCSHAAALVDDVMYVFGGLDADGRNLGDLFGLNLSTQEWFMLQKKEPSPSRRWGHAMVSNGTRVFVLGGKLAMGAQADETAAIYVLETKHIEKPKPDPNVNPNERTTQPALESSAGPSTQKRPQYPTSFSSDAYAAHNTSFFRNSTPGELDRPASPPISRERNLSSYGLPSQPTNVNGKTRHVPEKDYDDESWAEDLPDASSEGEVARLEFERVVELERQMSAMRAAQTERDQRLAELTEELALKSALLEQAEATATDRLHAQTSLKHKDAVLVRMQAKLDELVLSRDQQVRALEQAQSALQTAASRAAAADERSQRACEQIRQYETELAEVRAELKAGRSEFEAVRLRVTDAEIGLTKSKAEADTLLALTTAGLVGTDEDRMTRVLLERIRAMEAEMASRWSEKRLEALETRNEG